VLLIEDGLHALLPAALHDRAVLRQEDRDGLAAHDVVFLPDPRVAEQHHALLEVVVLGASRGARAAVARDDAHGARRHGPQNAVAALVEIDLHAVGVLHGVVLPRDDVAGEDHEAFLAEALHLVGIDGDRLRTVLLRLGLATHRRRRRLAGRRALRGRLDAGAGFAGAAFAGVCAVAAAGSVAITRVPTSVASPLIAPMNS